MTSQEPSPPPSTSSPFELRWRLFDIRFRISPSFWIVSALMGLIVIQSEQSMRQAMGFAPLATSTVLFRILIWVLCTLVSVLVHELGHVLMGRFFGQPGDISLAGLGGQAAGKYEALTPWQRIFVAAAGPGAGFLFLGLQILLDFTQWNLVMDWLGGGWLNLKVHWYVIDRLSSLRVTGNVDYSRTMYYLFLMGLFWNLLNLLPIFPMDGGMILRDLCIMISPSGGEKFAFGFSFLLAGLVTLYSLVIIAVSQRWIDVEALRKLPSIVDPYFGAIMFGIMAYQNFMYLWRVTVAQRSAQYQDRFED